MSAPFGTIAGEAPKKRTGQPVRSASFYEGEREHRIWRPFGADKKEAWQFHDAVIAAAERFNDLTKEPGKPTGLLGYYGPKVLRVLLSFADFMTGRLEPAQATIAARAGVHVRTVVRCLARLKKHGFLKWIHRCIPTDNDGAGPQVQPITNAYGFALKGRAAGLFRLCLNKLRLPPPADEVDRRRQDAEATEAMLARAGSEETARFVAGDSELGDALARLGRALDGSGSDSIPENPYRQE